MKLVLNSIDAAKVVDQISIAEFPTVIGRSAKADVIIDNHWISRVHCIFDRDRDRGHVVVRDLNSANGTYVNGVPVEFAALHTGDQLTLGVLSFAVYLRSGKVELPSTVIYQPPAHGALDA